MNDALIADAGGGSPPPAPPVGGGGVQPGAGGGSGSGNGASPAPPAGGGNSPPSPPAGTLSEGGVIDKTPAGPATWPDDWRQKLAGDDKAYLKTLERFADPGALAKSYREMQAKQSQMKAPPPAEGASPEEVATWRKENGLPEAPAGYMDQLALPNGMVIGEADKPIVSQFAEQAFADNIDPKAFNGLVAKYYAMQDAQAQERVAADGQFKITSQDALNKEWGAEFRPNINAISNLLSGAPEGVKDALFAGRTADGNIIGNDPRVLKWLAGLAREINPMGALMPAGTSQPMVAGENRIKEIEAIMRGPDADKAYWKNAEMQEEYRNLLSARQTMQERGR